jgi:hypothetical protein
MLLPFSEQINWALGQSWVARLGRALRWQSDLTLFAGDWMLTRIETDSPWEESKGKESGSFLKKRTKKLFIIQGMSVCIDRIKRRTKVFVSFFQKRNTFLLRRSSRLYAD